MVQLCVCDFGVRLCFVLCGAGLFVLFEFFSLMQLAKGLQRLLQMSEVCHIV